MLASNLLHCLSLAVLKASGHGGRGVQVLCLPLHDWYRQLVDILQLAVRIWMTDTKHAGHKQIDVIRRPHFHAVQSLCQLMQNPI